jgi:periplasmic protein TonB
MSYAEYNNDDLTLKRFFVYSIFLHALLTALLLVGIYLQRRGESWGSIGGAEGDVKVSLVQSAGIPMPQPRVFTDSHAIDPTKGLDKAEPPKPPEIETDAMKIPKFDLKEKKPLPPSKPSKVFEDKTPRPDNSIKYGQGGAPKLPSGYADNPGSGAPGVAVAGPGGDFASRYGWYVESVKRAINQNWLQNTIDPSVRAGHRAKTTMTFTINRDGSIKNIRMSESSGNRSMDDSAQRALLSIDHLPRLPSDYSGSYVDVTFDFDLAMTR